MSVLLDLCVGVLVCPCALALTHAYAGAALCALLWALGCTLVCLWQPPNYVAQLHRCIAGLLPAYVMCLSTALQATPTPPPVLQTSMELPAQHAGGGLECSGDKNPAGVAFWLSVFCVWASEPCLKPAMLTVYWFMVSTHTPKSQRHTYAHVWLLLLHRPAAGPCDVPEVCTAAGTCPEDEFVTAHCAGGIRRGTAALPVLVMGMSFPSLHCQGGRASVLSLARTL